MLDRGYQRGKTAATILATCLQFRAYTIEHACLDGRFYKEWNLCITRSEISEIKDQIM